MRLSLSIGLFVLLLAGTGCDNSHQTPGLIDGRTGRITYRIVGTATRVDIAFLDASNRTNTLSNNSVPWSYSWTATAGMQMFVSAKILDASGGSVTVTVEQDGTLVRTVTGEGSGMLVSAGGTFF